MKKSISRHRVIAIAIAAMLVPAAVQAETAGLWRSILLPGSGQAHEGHYTKAALFGGAAVVSGVALLATQVNYSRSSEQYNNSKRVYAAYSGQLSSGTIISQSEIDGTYATMQGAFDESDSRYKWRNVALGALVATYAINLVDILLGDADTGERVSAPAVSLNVTGNAVMLVKTLSF